MSNASEFRSAVAGTLFNDRGGKDSFDGYFDIVVTCEKAAVDAAAGDATNRNCWRNKTGMNVRLESAEYVPDAALTAHDTNFATVSVLKGASAAVTTSAASKTTVIANGDWVADTPVALTLSATAANRVLAADDILCLDIAKAAAGVAVPAGVLVCKLRRV